LKALVTGAGGFLGRYIVEALVARGDAVRAFSRQRYAFLDALGVESHVGDLRDASQVSTACDGVDVVFHAASIAGIWGRWETYYSINVLGSQNVISACRRHNVRRLVYTSSPSVTFTAEDQAGVDETAPYAREWLCHYPHTKAIAEQEVLQASDEKLATCSLRPHLIWGPRDPHLIPRLLARAKRKRLRRVGDGTNLIDITYVENAADAHLAAADALAIGGAVAGQAYFLSQGAPVNCWGWIDEVLALAEVPPVGKSISFLAAWRLGHALERAWSVMRIEREPPMTRFLAAQLAKSHYFDISKARRDFGYSPRVSTVEGMGRLAQSLRAPHQPEA
jgi:nucleoside-diphosphate-sugar epimerase